MQLVIDANILFSALIKNSRTRKILFDENIELFAPEFILVEFEKYKSVILKKTKKSEKEFEQLKEIFKELIELIPFEDYEFKLNTAKQISPDLKDCDYFAIALIRRCPLWSNDKLLKEQKIIQVFSTEDLVKKFSF